MTRAQITEAQRLARTWKPGARPETTAAATAGRPGGTARDTVRSIQKSLAALGYDPGPADGAMGPRTSAAIREFQADYGLPVTGQASGELELSLRMLAGEGGPHRATRRLNWRTAGLGSP
jgi:peptidoglycan hydrolase-like protein with peptidoglycan-binding domain